MSSLQIFRLAFGAPERWYEQLGDPVTNLGGATVPAIRTALRHAVDLPTYSADGAVDTLAARLANRRRLRSLLNNTPLKMQGYTYVLYSDDPEQNGWYVLDQGQLADGDGASGLATGWWKLANVNWSLIGHRRVSREARNIWMKDLRTGLWARDTLRGIYSTDFSTLSALALNVFPPGATQLMNAVTQQRAVPVTVPACRDGGVCLLVAGRTHLAVISYDRSESSMNTGDVVAYDRRGAGDAPTTGPGVTWEEVYGPDYPWNWLTAGQPNDAPVLDNGLIRARYDASTGLSGVRVDVWNGAAYVEQGKLNFFRFGDSGTVFDDTFISAGLYADSGYTPDRAVMELVLASSGDTSSRERIFITMQRGSYGITVECYPSPVIAGTLADAGIEWTPTTGDVNDSAFKIDSVAASPPAAGSGVVTATAGSGSANFAASTTLGASSFASSENYLVVLRCSAAAATLSAWQQNLIVVQATNGKALTNRTSNAYASASNCVDVVGKNGTGYVSVDLSLSPTVADQVMEAEAMTLGTGTAITADGSSSSGSSTTATRTTDANPHVTRAAWPNAELATFRVFVRMKVSANSASVYAKTGATTGATLTALSNTTYAWKDLGDIVANNTTFEIHAWMSGGAGTVSIDRVEAFLAQDRARSSAIYSGARDNAQAALMDGRQLGSVVSR